MANEISVITGISVVNGNSITTVNAQQFQASQAAVGGPVPGSQTIGTSEETISLAELTSKGWVFLKNNGPTNYLEWGFTTAVYGGRLLVGESAVLRLNPAQASLFLKANVAEVNATIFAFEA